MLTTTGCLNRQQRLRAALAEQNIDAAVISDRHEIYYFTGMLLPVYAFVLPAVLWVDAQTTWLIAPMNMGAAAVDELLPYEAVHNSTTSADWLRSISTLLAAKLGGGSLRRLGWQCESLPRLLGSTIDLAVHPDEWIALDDLLTAMEARKDPDELDLIRRSVAIDLAAYHAVEPLIRPGANELDILAAAQRAAMREAGEIVWHGGDYCSGTGGGAARDRAIEAGELYIVDAWTQYRGYWSDLSRTYIVGDEISPLQQSIFDHLAAIHERLPDMLQPGVPGEIVWAQIDTLVRQHPALAADGLVHHAGHSIGLRAHEMPDLNPDRGGTLAVGNVINVEPGGYVAAARYGVRLENMYLITETGVENLSPHPMRLR
jgi:Xaa-Pro dipeptidase